VLIAALGLRCFVTEANMMGDQVSPTLTVKTGQQWKLYSGLALFIVGGVSVLSASTIPIVRAHGLFAVFWLGGFLAAGAGCFILLILIRCPSCRCHFILRALKTFSLEEWLDHGLFVDICPCCGFGGEEKRS
jgi:hypothetical protein